MPLTTISVWRTPEGYRSQHVTSHARRPTPRGQERLVQILAGQTLRMDDLQTVGNADYACCEEES